MKLLLLKTHYEEWGLIYEKEFNDKLKDIASAAADPTLEIVSENLIEGVAGTIVPGDGIRFCFCCPI